MMPGPRGIRFAAAGAVTTVAHYGLLIVMVELLHLDGVVAAVMSYAAAAVLNYALHARWTFRFAGSHTQAVGRYGVVLVIGFSTTWGAMQAMTGMPGWHYLPSQLLTTVLILAITYSLHRSWTFRAAPSR